MCDPYRFHVLASIFSRGIADKARAYNIITTLATSQRSRLRESISVDVRKLCDIAIPEARCPEISAAAHSAAEAIGVDLTEQSWHTQPKFDLGRQVFHYEHLSPVSASVAAVLGCGSSWEVTRCLDATVRVAWITKEEDRELTRLGFASRRPDPDAAYAASGIDLRPTHGPLDPTEFEDDRDVPPDDLGDLVLWLGAQLQQDIVLAEDHHESGCRDPQSGQFCSCGLPKRLAQDATNKVRIVSGLRQRDEPEPLALVARLLAHAYLDRDGFRESWLA